MGIGLYIVIGIVVMVFNWFYDQSPSQGERTTGMILGSVALQIAVWPVYITISLFKYLKMRWDTRS